MANKFILPALPYAYNALEPYIDEATLKIHHDKHHQTYCDKFNAALEAAELNSEDIFEIMGNVSNLPAVRNHGGGFFNHTFYWESMAGSCDGPEKLPEIAKAVTDTFGSFEKFKDEFSKSAASVFGSGWTWLGVESSGELVIYNTPNQDNAFMDICDTDAKPILVIDVWEHAYYIKYQNRRPEYIEQFFKVINWNKVQERLLEIRKN